LASDVSSIIKEDISTTLESLLSTTSSIDDVTKITSLVDVSKQQCIKIDTEFEFSKFQIVKVQFYIPADLSTRFEYLMLGGATDLKESIDDEVLDAVNEIVSNICGSISTDINAQGFDDLGSMKFTIINKEIIECLEQSNIENCYKYDIKLGDENSILYISFDGNFIPYLGYITSEVQPENISKDLEMVSTHPLLALIGEESVDNLKLLFDIKFKLSVRLGYKVVLLKDIMEWDTGTIIELSQMVNQPLDILANDIKISEGEAVIVEGKFGVKIKNIGQKNNYD
jgi:flagellar motor switch protein FliN/FliY